MKTIIAPSILSADFGRLAEQIGEVDRAGADWIHVDVMDGVFVPNITIGPLVIKRVRDATKLPLDVHLMIVEPDRHLSSYVDAGADFISVHAETCIHLHRTLQNIRSLGVKAGVAFNPATPIDSILPVLDLVDLVVIMSVNPGFGGQKFISSVLPKIEKVRTLIRDAGLDIRIEVDGGVGPKNSGTIIGSGADVLVAGNAVFGTNDYAEAIRNIRDPKS